MMLKRVWLLKHQIMTLFCLNSWLPLWFINIHKLALEYWYCCRIYLMESYLILITCIFKELKQTTFCFYYSWMICDPLCCLQLFLILSCSIAVGTNLSQFICIGRFTAVSFQVLGHMKTILVLILGFIIFGKEGLNPQVLRGMIVAVVGMIWYSSASSKPGGKERRAQLLPTRKFQIHRALSESSELDGKP